jgi:hypothetical protein
MLCELVTSSFLLCCESLRFVKTLAEERRDIGAIACEIFGVVKMSVEIF